jgi:hypothetical protein
MGQERETIDRIRDRLGDEGFVAFCVGNEMRYLDRAGRKEGNSTSDELRKALWYYEMGLHVRRPDRHPDPREGRLSFQPYVRQEP